MYMYIRKCVYIYQYMYMYLYVCVHTHTQTHNHTHIYLYICKNMSESISVFQIMLTIPYTEYMEGKKRKQAGKTKT